MAFSSRAYRDTSTSKPFTGPQVGPGSYGSEPRPTEHAYAPFQSTATRELANGSATTTYTPGPGYYDTLATTQRLVASVHLSSDTAAPFHTTTPKMPADKSSWASNPGPGNYKGGLLEPQWVRKTHRYEGKSKSRVAPQRHTSAPSVPGRTQVYGYEENDFGELVRQPPPAVGHSGVKGDSPGPLDYSPDKLKLLTHAPATGWGFSKSERSTFKLGNKIPGPGDYEAHVALDKLRESHALSGTHATDAGTGADPEAPAQTSSFATKTLRATQSQTYEGQVLPGPGDYFSRYKDAIKATKAVPKRHQCFSSTQRRAYDVDPQKMISGPSYLKGPGPGSYTQSSSFGRAPLADPQCSAFSSTQKRLHLGQSDSPGPGDYDKDNEYSLSADVAKRISARSGAFGSTLDRFRTEPKRKVDGKFGVELLPGPQSYNPHLPPKVDRKPTSVFASGTKRLKPVRSDTTQPKYSEFEGDQEVMGDPRNLGPGSYQLVDGWKGRSKHGNYKNAPGFDTGLDRFATRDSATPSPGAYYVRDINKTMKHYSVPLAAFGAGDTRLKDNGKFTPGPGTYNLLPSWDKRSFNITLDNTYLGDDAFKFFPITTGYGPNAPTRLQRPLSGRQIAALKKEHLMSGKEWPYEHLSPSKPQPLNHPARWPKGTKHDRTAGERQQTIAKNMAQMDKWIQESKEKKKLPSDIAVMDTYFMTKKQLLKKYVKTRVQK